MDYTNLVMELLSYIDYGVIQRFPFKRKNLIPIKQRKRKLQTISFHDDSASAPSTSKCEIAIIFIAHKGVWHEKMWQKWRNNESVAFFVHKDQEGRDFPPDSEPFGQYVPNPIPVERGKLSHVKAILHSLHFAKASIPTLEKFFIFSGDAIPLKSVYEFFSIPKTKSILSYRIEEDAAEEEEEAEEEEAEEEEAKEEEEEEEEEVETDLTSTNIFVRHNMEMMLCRRDTHILTTQLYKDVFTTEKYKLDDELANERNMLDEYVIGSYLYNAGIQDMQNSTIAGWIAIDNPSESLRSVILQSETQTISCDENEDIIIPNSETGNNHISLCTNNKEEAGEEAAGEEEADEEEADEEAAGEEEAGEEEAGEEEAGEEAAGEEEAGEEAAGEEEAGEEAAGEEEAGEEAAESVAPNDRQISIKTVANNILFAVPPYDDFLVFRKISPTFDKFIVKLNAVFELEYKKNMQPIMPM